MFPSGLGDGKDKENVASLVGHGDFPCSLVDLPDKTPMDRVL